MNNRFLSVFFVFVLVMFSQSSAYAKEAILGALSLGNGGLLSSLPILGGGMELNPISTLLDAGEPVLGLLSINLPADALQGIAPLLGVLPVDQLLVPDAPIVGLLVTDLPIGTLASEGVSNIESIAGILLPGSADLDTLWATILRLE